TVIVDNTAPTALITSPANNAVVQRSKIVAITATVRDNVQLSKVEFYVNGKRKCTDSKAPHICKWKVPSKANTPYVLAVKATDKAGNIAVTSVNALSSQ
ncbi:MAG TPA: Ig-like domain-containing protein, partial [Candidatus Nanoarchaeia archaeon]|nr:Ig-like domain-containing protein [Candidatus Nanoarchaeia archaeon]